MGEGRSTMESLVRQKKFWSNKKVLVIGHTGFKGSWLCLLLSKLGATLSGYALEPHTFPSLYEQLKLGEIVDSTIADIRDLEALKYKFKTFQPEVVIHMAAQPIVLDAYTQPVETYAINVMGTVHVLEAIRCSNSVKSAIIVTTDKCYQNISSSNRKRFHEMDVLGGDDPYSSSKACCELVTTAYYKSFLCHKLDVGVASVRAGNVIGGGDWAKYRLIPDIIRNIENKTTLSLRYPHAVRPWQHVLDVLTGYLLLAQRLWEKPTTYSSAWNFGPGSESAVSVEEIVNILNQQLQYPLSYEAPSVPKLHEAEYLALDSNKARTQLGWISRLNLNKALTLVADWYSEYLNRKNLIKITNEQVNNFIGA
jgi:CDP-glucose 4,6-dehydratase